MTEDFLTDISNQFMNQSSGLMSIGLRLPFTFNSMFSIKKKSLILTDRLTEESLSMSVLKSLTHTLQIGHHTHTGVSCRDLSGSGRRLTLPISGEVNISSLDSPPLSMCLIYTGDGDEFLLSCNDDGDTHTNISSLPHTHRHIHTNRVNFP